MSSTDALGRFTDVALLIMLSISSGDKHGYAMLHDIATFSGTQLEPGTLYGALLRLEQRGWVAALPAADRRHPYHLTGAGAAALREQLVTLQRLVDTGIARQAMAST
jgi:DNA-binding PadR family transcriptional regulator